MIFCKDRGVLLYILHCILPHWAAQEGLSRQEPQHYFIFYFHGQLLFFNKSWTGHHSYFDPLVLHDLWISVVVQDFPSLHCSVPGQDLIHCHSSIHSQPAAHTVVSIVSITSRSVLDGDTSGQFSCPQLLSGLQSSSELSSAPSSVSSSHDSR
ncbi:hypothetical protein FKM82_024065 [Ascaphus truei]